MRRPKIGDKIYYVNSGRTIDTYTVIDTTDKTATIKADITDIDIETRFDIFKFVAGELPRLFLNYDLAVRFKASLDDEYEKERQKKFEEILEEALHSTTLTEVEKNGILLKEHKTDFEEYYSDTSGGEWYVAKLYQYNGKQYIVVHKHIKDKDGNIHTECVKFSERTY